MQIEILHIYIVHRVRLVRQPLSNLEIHYGDKTISMLELAGLSDWSDMYTKVIAWLVQIMGPFL